MVHNSLTLHGLLILAWRNLWRNHRRTLIMLAAIVIGVWAMIIFSSMMRGMMDEMINTGLRVLPGEVQIHHPEYRDDPSVANSMAAPSGQLLEALSRPPVTGWAARLKVPGMAVSERDSRGVLLLGVNPAAEQALGSAPEKIVAGRSLQDSGDRGVVIGAKLAERLETSLGKRIVVMSQDPDNDVVDRGVRIVGIYEARLEATEERHVYFGLETLQIMLRVGDQVSEVAVTASDYTGVDSWWRAIAQAAGPTVSTLPWTELNAYLATMMSVQGTINLVIMVIIFVVLAFGLVNTLIMAVFERVREIGLMMALGMRPASIIYQVLVESVMLLLLGLLVGNILAVATVLPLEAGIDLTVVGDGLEMYGMGVTLYPQLAWQDMLVSNAVVLVLGLAASVVPAWRASRYNPIQALAKT